MRISYKSDGNVVRISREDFKKAVAEARALAQRKITGTHQLAGPKPPNQTDRQE